MSRYNSNSSYGHRWTDMGDGEYRISWKYDKYYSNSRLRFPQVRERYTDLKGCLEFCKKWGIDSPIVKEAINE